MKFINLFLLLNIIGSFSFAQSQPANTAGTSLVLYDKTVSIGSSKAVVNFNLDQSDSEKKKKWYNDFDLNEEEKAREKWNKNFKVENLKWQQKELFTAKGLAKSYMGQSFLFLFWLGAAQIYHCYNDYAQNPMACYQFLLSEASGIHRAGLMAFVVASGFASTSPGLYNLGFKMFKRNRFTETFMSTTSLTLGVTAQSVLMQFLQYYLQDEDNKNCSRKLIIQQELAERRRWGNKVNYDDAIEQDPCRLAADKSTAEYMKNHFPPQIASLWATMPILFALQTSLGMAVSPSGLGLVSGLQKIAEQLGGTSKAGGTSVARFDFQIAMQKVSHKLGSFYKMTFDLKKNSKIFNLAEYILKPGSWWHSGLNLLAFIGISEALTPMITEAWFKKVSSNFDESNEVFLRTMVDMGSAESRNFLVQPGCNHENALTCEPPASIFLSRLRKDFSYWREIKLQSFVVTYQGWQQKIQELVRGFNTTLRFYNEIALSLFKVKNVVPPWKKQTTLGGIYTLVPDNVNDENDLFLSPSEYYGPMSERAFLVGLGIKTYLTFYAKEAKFSNQFTFPSMNKREKFKSLVKEFEFNFQGLDNPEIKTTLEKIKKSESFVVQDFEPLFKKALEVLHQSHHAHTIQKFESYRDNSNYLKWLVKLDQISNKLIAGFLLNTKVYGIEHLRPQATAVKKYVQMTENKDYTHKLFLDEQKDAQVSLDVPMKMFGTDAELVRVIEIVGKLYYTTVLRDSDYMYSISKDQYSEIQSGINEFMGIVDFVNKKDLVDKVSSFIAGAFPKLVEWGWFSKDSLAGLYTFDRKFNDFLIQIPETFAAKIYNLTPVAEITRITNTIYSGLGAPYAPQNEAQAFKERYMRYTTEGRNHTLYSLPNKSNQIITKTIFDSMIIGMICGPARADSIFKVSHVSWDVPNDVDYKDFFPDQFKPFRLVDLNKPKVKAFCSKTIENQEELNKNLPEAFSILESELGSLRLPKLSQELIGPEYISLLMPLYCNIKEWSRGTKKQEKIKNWTIKSKNWSKYEEIFCRAQENDEPSDRTVINEQSVSLNEINGLINDTTDLVNSLSRGDRDAVIKEYIRFVKGENDKVEDFEVDEMYRSIKSLALQQTLAVRGTIFLEKVLQNYQLLYNAKLPVLEEILIGKGETAKRNRAIVESNYQDIKSLKYSDVTDHGKEFVSPRVAPLTENKFQESMALALLQESSYYLAFFSKVYTYYFNEKAHFENKNADLMMQMSPFLENYNRNASVFQTILAQVGAADTKYYLPRAPVFIWTMNNLVTEALKSIINKDDKNSKQALTKLNELVDYLDIVVLKIKLAEDHYNPEQLVQLQSTFNAEGAKELNLSASERAVMRTWLVHFRSFIFDLMSLSAMIQPLNFENATSQNYK